MTRTVRRLRRMASGTSLRSEWSSRTSPASRARSVPAAMAKPASDCARAAASLMPSPAMPTRWCCDWSSRMAASLPPGSRLARTSVDAGFAGDGVGGGCVSPVSMSERMPSVCRSRMVSAASGRSWSVAKKTACGCESDQQIDRCGVGEFGARDERGIEFGRRAGARRCREESCGPVRVARTPMPGMIRRLRSR